jgi:2-C-methyl-D-erythritol 4-phosphate cytidylyltransferase
VVIVAAGQGVRAGGEGPKQFRELAGIPMLLWSLRTFLSHPEVGPVVVVLPAATADAPPPWLGDLADERLRLVAGGPERIDSVERGVRALGGACAVVVVHDGARPFVERDTVDAVIAAARAGQGAVAAIPVSDTLKRGVGTRVEATVPRDGLWRAQTPQAFPRDLLAAGLTRARALGMVATDDAAMVEAAGGAVVLVPDRSTNFKVTTPEDFAIAEAVARGRR